MRYSHRSGGVLVEGSLLSATVAVRRSFAQTGFDYAFPGLGAAFVAITLIFFYLTTVIACYYTRRPTCASSLAIR